MSNLQNASLVLSTNNGTFNNAARTSTTWYNINLRTLLGDMYDKYDLFNLCLNTIATGVPPSAFNTAAQDLQTLIRINGLPFINNTYNINGTNNANTNNCIIGTFTFASTSYATANFNLNIATFGKNQDICNITIDYLRVNDLAPPSVVGANPYFPQTTFIFDIYGIDKEKNNLNATRMT